MPEAERLLCTPRSCLLPGTRAHGRAPALPGSLRQPAHHDADVGRHLRLVRTGGLPVQRQLPALGQEAHPRVAVHRGSPGRVPPFPSTWTGTAAISSERPPLSSTWTATADVPTGGGGRSWVEDRRGPLRRCDSDPMSADVVVVGAGLAGL